MVHRVQAKAKKSAQASESLERDAGVLRVQSLQSGRRGAIRWDPKEYQIPAVEFILKNAGAGLFLDPGLGKTSIVLTALQALKDAGNLKRALIVAPLRVMSLVWPAELDKWNHLNLTMTILHGPNKGHALKEATDIHVINPEGLAWLFSMLSSNKLPYDFLVIDESTKFKNWTAQRTKILRKQVGKFPRRVILTGTPAPNGVADLFSQIFVLDFGRALGKFITHFRSRFMMQTGYGGYEYVLKEGAQAEIEERIAPLTLRLSAEDWLKLPPLIHNRITVALPPPALAQYRELESEFLLKFNEGKIVPANAAVAGMKLRQIANGQVYLDGGGVQPIHEAKLEALDSLVEDANGQSMLIAVAFIHEVEAIKRYLKLDIPYLGGGVTPKTAQQIVDSWNAGKLPLLLAHPSSISHGLNLQGGRHVCWYGLTWNLEEYLQLIARVHRQGQTQRVLVHSIVAEDTIDVEIEHALRNKNNLQKALLSALQKHNSIA